MPDCCGGSSRDTALEAYHRKESKTRGCTDVVPLLAFLVNWGVLCYVVHLARTTGDFDRVIFGLDYKGDLCGQDNSEAATGLPAVIETTVDERTVAEAWFPFFAAARTEDGEEKRRTVQLRRGARDHTARPYLYYTLPLGALDAWSATAVCVAECPGWADANATVDDLADPATWVCTGKYSGGPPAACPGGAGDALECVEYRSRFFTNVDPEEAARCREPMDDCDVCYPPYRTLGVLNYCLPDPHHALETFQTLAVAVGAVGVAIGGGDFSAANASAAALANASALPVPEGLTISDLERCAPPSTPSSPPHAPSHRSPPPPPQDARDRLLAAAFNVRGPRRRRPRHRLVRGRRHRVRLRVAAAAAPPRRVHGVGDARGGGGGDGRGGVVAVDHSGEYEGLAALRSRRPPHAAGRRVLLRVHRRVGFGGDLPAAAALPAPEDRRGGADSSGGDEGGGAPPPPPRHAARRRRHLPRDHRLRLHRRRAPRLERRAAADRAGVRPRHARRRDARLARTPRLRGGVVRLLGAPRPALRRRRRGVALVLRGRQAPRHECLPGGGRALQDAPLPRRLRRARLVPHHAAQGDPVGLPHPPEEDEEVVRALPTLCPCATLRLRRRRRLPAPPLTPYPLPPPGASAAASWRSCAAAASSAASAASRSASSSSRATPTSR